MTMSLPVHHLGNDVLRNVGVTMATVANQLVSADDIVRARDEHLGGKPRLHQLFHPLNPLSIARHVNRRVVVVVGALFSKEGVVKKATSLR